MPSAGGIDEARIDLTVVVYARVETSSTFYPYCVIVALARKKIKGANNTDVFSSRSSK